MADFEDTLQSIMGNPQVMQQILSMANSMSSSGFPPEAPPQPSPGDMPFSSASLQNMMDLVRKTQLDSKQAALIQAMEGYLPQERVNRLKKAMQAAKIARYASQALGMGSEKGG